ncbi:MAG: acyl-CoA-binding protein [Flavobacteriaceae bacterium]|jgi:acyl-CoA-binding protein|nr:acyl-CoA-binding protein [Flavobacteriaceae bacterium]
MKDKALEKSFTEAVAVVNSYKKPIQADVLLKLYAYYKKANQNSAHPGSKKPLINGFKINALLQVGYMPIEEAKKAYVDLVNEYFGKS